MQTYESAQRVIRAYRNHTLPRPDPPHEGETKRATLVPHSRMCRRPRRHGVFTSEPPLAGPELRARGIDNPGVSSYSGANGQSSRAPKTPREDIIYGWQEDSDARRRLHRRVRD